MIHAYFTSLYRRTMRVAYATAIKEICLTLANGGRCIDCGAQAGQTYDVLCREIPLSAPRYFGLEWNHDSIRPARQRGLNIIQGDLNAPLPYRDHTFNCVFALSVLEHLTKGCRFISECHRVLRPQGRLILLTSNISTFFSVFQLMMGKMPSSGPHPDSNLLLADEKPMQVSSLGLADVEEGFPQHRHMVVFSFRVLKKYLRMAGFSEVRAYEFGL